MFEEDAANAASGGDTEPDNDSLDGVERSSLGQNLAYMFSSQVATWSLAFALAIIAPRYLGPEAVGQLRLATSLWMITGVFVGLGTARYLVLNIARYRGRSAGLLGPVIVLRLIVFLLATAGFAIYIGVGDVSSELTWLIVLVGLATLFQTLSDALGSAFIGLERMSTPAFANVVGRVLGAVVSIAVLLLGGDVIAVAAASALGSAVSTIVLYRSVRKILTLSFRGWSGHASTIVRGSVGFMVASAALICYQQIDTIVIAALVDREALGWYGTADVLFGTLLFPITILMGSFFPVLGRLFTEDPDELEALVIRTFRSLLVVAIPLGLGTMVVAPQLSVLVLGEEFRETGEVLVVLGPVLILTFGTIMFGSLAQASGRQRFWSLVMIGATLLTIPLDLVFVPWSDSTYANGAIGGAMAYLVTEALMSAVGLWKIAPYLVSRATAWRVGRNLLAGLLMVGASYPFRDRFLAIPVLVAVVVYFVAILALRIVTDDERAMVAQVLAKVGIGSGSHEPPESNESAEADESAESEPD